MNPLLIPMLIVPPLLGWLFLQLYLCKSKIPLKNLLSIILAPTTGFALISLTLFICYVFQPQQVRLVTVLLPWFFILIFMIALNLISSSAAREKTPPSSIRSLLSSNLPLTPFKILQFSLYSILAIVLVYICTNFVGRIVDNMAWNPFGGWDARYFWHLKSRFLFRDPEQWQLMFSEYLRWGNKDYPLMIPGIITWGWHFIGRESLLWPMIISLVFVGSLGGIIIWYLAAWCSWLTALIAGIFFFALPAYTFWGGTLYCDIPYALFSNSALLLLITALRLKDLPLLSLSAFFAGCSVFTKNEGVFFITWYILLTACAFGLRKTDSRGALLKKIIALTTGLLLPLCVFAYFKLVLATGRPLHIGNSSPTDILDNLTNWPRNGIILKAFKMYMSDSKNWNGLWFMFLTAIIYWPIARKTTVSSYYGMLLPAILLINLGYAVVIAIAPYNIYKIIPETLMRLLLQTGGLALVFIFETFGFARKQKQVT